MDGWSASVTQERHVVYLIYRSVQFSLSLSSYLLPVSLKCSTFFLFLQLFHFLILHLSFIYLLSSLLKLGILRFYVRVTLLRDLISL